MNAWERQINAENTELAAQGRAVVIQIPTPHHVVDAKDAARGRFVVQYQESTVDFLGHGSGLPVAIEAKATRDASLTVYMGRKGSGLKRHQRNFLAHWARGGVAVVYLLDERTGDRYVLPVDSAGVVAGIDIQKRKSFKIDPASPFRCRDDETWLDAVERLQ